MTAFNENNEPIQPTIADAIRDAIDPNNKGLLLTKYVMIAEVIDSNGTRGLVRLFDDTLAVWDAVGMLRSVATELEQQFAYQDATDLHGEIDG